MKEYNCKGDTYADALYNVMLEKNTNDEELTNFIKENSDEVKGMIENDLCTCYWNDIV